MHKSPPLAHEAAYTGSWARALFKEFSSRKSMKRLHKGCGYQGFEFGARNYPDSLCCGGRLYDVDDFDEPMEDIPCPNCRENDAIDYWSYRFALGGEKLLSARNTAESLVAQIRQSRAIQTQQCNAKERELRM
jgi:hypothetical protein